MAILYNSLSTVLNNSSNNSTSDASTFVSNLFASESSITDAALKAEVDAIASAIQAAINKGSLNATAQVSNVNPGPALTSGGNVLYTTTTNFNETIKAVAGTGTVNILLGSNSVVKFGTATPAARASDPGHAPVAAASGAATFNVVASGGENSITLNKSASQVTSTVGNDAIVSRGGKDTITGGSGHDTITAGGQSFVQAGTAGDTVTGGLKATSHDTIVGGSGSDQIVVAHGNNLLVGTTGRTYLQAGDGLDTVLGGTGRETIWGSGSTYIQAVRGNIVHGQGSDTIYGGDGRNTIFSGSGGQFIEGGKGHLEINVSNNASDTIFGGSAHDVVHVAQPEANITDTSTSGKTQTITFANGQTLTTQNVTIEFKDHHK